MLDFSDRQQTIVDLDQKVVIWVIRVWDKDGAYYPFYPNGSGHMAVFNVVAWDDAVEWVSGVQWTDGEASEGDTGYLLTDFSGIELSRNMAENKIISPSETSFKIANSQSLDYADFKGGYFSIDLYLWDQFGFSGYGSDGQKMATWKFKIKKAEPGYQTIKITGEGYFDAYLRGYYPNTRLPEDIFPSNRAYEKKGLCIPVPFGTAYVPLRDVFITDDGFLVLGDTTTTYTINKIRSPRSLGLKSEWSSDSYTFTQYTKADQDSDNWRVFQAVIADSDNDGTADDHGFWGTAAGTILDSPVEFTRSDTSTKTNPADVIEFVLEDMGVPSDMIDADSFASASSTYDSWGLEFNGAFWYKQEREKVLAELLVQCHSCLQITEKIELHVLSKTSQFTVTTAHILDRSFLFKDIENQDIHDSAYVSWQSSGEAQDEFVKSLVAADGSTTDSISNFIVECPLVQDSQDVRRIGQLALQRKFLKQAEISFKANSKLLAIQPDDVITLNDSNYGGTYTILVDKVTIRKDVSIDIRASKFSSTFDDWGDVSPDSITVGSDSTTQSWRPAISGPDSDGDANVVSDRIRLGDTTSHVVLDGADPVRISVYDSGTEVARIGALNGFLGFGSGTFGISAFPEVAASSTGTLTKDECNNRIINNYGQTVANTQTLPACSEGLSGTVVIGTSGTGAFHLKAGVSDKIYLNGTALDDGDKVTIATPAVGNYLVFWSFKTGASAYDWFVVSGNDTVAIDGGA